MKLFETTYCAAREQQFDNEDSRNNM